MPDSETKHSRVLLLDDVENMLEAARPRLLRFACASGVTPDAADDVVQETLLTAWRSLERLNSPEGFQAWLYGICRNMCLRWSEAQRHHRQRQTRSIPLDTFDGFEHSLFSLITREEECLVAAC